MKDEKTKVQIPKDEDVVEEAKVVEKATKPKTVVDKLLSITWNQMNKDTFRSIFVSEKGKCFIVKDQKGNCKPSEGKVPFGSDKKKALKELLSNGKKLGFKYHRIMPKDGEEFSELYVNKIR